MAGYSPKSLKSIQPFVRQHVASARDGGVFANKSGYHNSYENLVAQGKTGDYSIQDKRDKTNIDKKAAAAFDITMSDVDMRKATARLVAAMKARDPRLVGKLREFGGTLDSKRVTAYRIEDQKTVPFDSSHLWHVHGSAFRNQATSQEVANGFAEVIAGVAMSPYVWDGISFPGSSRFYIGAEGAWITYLGERLVKHGWTSYTQGPGPTFTEVDKAAVKWFQEQQGWKGTDADGFPGAETWKRLVADPVVVPEPSEPVLYPEPENKDVYLDRLISGQKNSDSVWQLQNALRVLGYDIKLTGAYDEQTIDGVKRYQSALGDKDIDGLVGPLQTNRIFKDAGIDINIVVPEPEKPKPPPVIVEPPVKKLQFVWANHNMLQDSDKREPWSTREPKLAKFYVDSGASVFTWQEIDPNATDTAQALKVVKRMGSKWWCDRGGPNAACWDSTKWDWVQKEIITKKLTHISGYGVRYLHVVPLVDKSSGQKVWFASVHLNHKTGTIATGLRKTQAQEVVKYLKPLLDKGELVCLGGDFNASGTGAADPKGILKAAGLLLLSQQAGVVNRNVESHHGLAKPDKNNKWIDDEAWGKKLTYVSGAQLDTYKNRLSDHNMQIVTLKRG